MGVETTAWPQERAVRAVGWTVDISSDIAADWGRVRQLDCAYFLLVLTILTVLCALRLHSTGSWSNFRKISLPRKLILVTLLDSWLFCYASAVLLFGVGSSLNAIACEVGIFWCILLYASSKIMIYLFLMERLHLVHSTTKHDATTFKDRFRSPWYRVAALLLIAWLGVATVMVIGRNAVLKPDGECKIGLKLYSTIPMLAVDVIVNIFLTIGFVYPVMKAGFSSAKALVKDSCLAAFAALITSFANICILAIMKGHQMSYICLTSCVFDVAANACILWFITRGKSGTDGTTTEGESRRGTTGKSHLRPNASRKGSFVTGSRCRQSSMYGSGTLEGVQIARVQHSVIDMPDESTPTFVLSDYDFPCLPAPVELSEKGTDSINLPLGSTTRLRDTQVQFQEEKKGDYV